MKLSFLIAFLLPSLTMAMTMFSEQARLASQPMSFLLIRQNHIFLTLLICNMLFPLMAINLFFKEFQYGTIVDIISVPVKRTSYLVAKEIIMFIWGISVGLFSYLICIIPGAIIGMEGFTLDLVLLGLWRALALAISFIPLQLVIWLTLLFKNYVVSLGVSIVTVIGTIVAYNTKSIIFVYLYSIHFVLTNFQTQITMQQLMTSVTSLAVVAGICLPGIFISFTRMDI